MPLTLTLFEGPVHFFINQSGDPDVGTKNPLRFSPRTPKES